MEVFLSFITIPIMLIISVAIAYYLIGKLLTFLTTVDVRKKGNNR